MSRFFLVSPFFTAHVLAGSFDNARPIISIQEAERKLYLRRGDYKHNIPGLLLQDEPYFSGGRVV